MIGSKYLCLIKNKYKGLMDEQLMKNFQWASFGAIGASIVMFFVQIISGRVLGPEQYGIASFVLLAANTLRVLCTSGADMSLAKELARADQHKRTVYISSTLFLTVVSLVFFGIALYAIMPFVRAYDPSYIPITVIIYVLICIFGFKFVFESIARGFFLFKKQASYRIVETGVILFLVFVLFLVLSMQSYIYFVGAMGIGSLVVIILYGVNFTQYVHLRNIEIPIVQKIFRSGVLFASSSIIAGFVCLVDRFVVGEYLGQEALGIYSAYALVSITVAGLATTIVNTVFFVHVAQHKQVTNLVRKIDHIFVRGFIPSFVLLCIVSSIAITFFGHAYTFNIVYIIFFSFYASLSIFGSFYSPVITTYSNRVYGRTLIIFIARVCLLVLYYITLIHYGAVSIPLVLSGLIFDYILALIIVRVMIWKFVR